MLASKTEQMVTRRRGEKKQNFLAIEALEGKEWWDHDVCAFTKTVLFLHTSLNASPHTLVSRH